MKLWGSVRKGAGKLAFEGEKAVRIKREEAAISKAEAEIEEQCTALGKAALALLERGELEHPTLMPYLEQVRSLRARIDELEAKVASIKAEEFVSEEEEEATEPEPVEPVASGPEPEEQLPTPPQAESAPLPPTEAEEELPPPPPASPTDA